MEINKLAIVSLHWKSDFGELFSMLNLSVCKMHLSYLASFEKLCLKYLLDNYESLLCGKHLVQQEWMPQSAVCRSSPK